jgi:hypothetical protein
MYKITNRTFPKLPAEEIEQKELVRILRRNDIFFFAANNENNQSFANRGHAIKLEAKAKAMGKLRGTSDLCIFGLEYIIFIELKKQRPILKSGKRGAAKSKPSEEQLEFIEKSNQYDYCKSFVAYGCDEALAILKQFKFKKDIK